MKQHIIIYTLTLAMLVSLKMQADVYDDAAVAVFNGSPRLQELRQQSAAEILSLKADNALAPLDLDFESLWSRDGEHRWSTGISQSFDFPGAYRARAREREALLQASRMELRASYIAEIQRAYELLVEVAYCNKAIALEEKIVKDMTDMTAMLETSFKNGEATILEVNRSKIELANCHISLRDYVERRSSAVAQLVTLGCNVESADVNYPIFTLMPLEQYLVAVNDDPTVQYYVQQQSAVTAGVKSRKLESLPGISIGYVHEFEENTHFNGFSVSLSLPVYAARNKVKAARARVDAAKWSIDAARIERESVITVQYSAAQANKQLFDMLSPVFYQTDHLSLLNKAFMGGQMSAIEYLRETSYFHESERDFLDVEYQYRLSLVKLNTPLSDFGSNR
ncbi:MAG: TolC family protein [Muribaculaceae bacterium]|nr:TolC family protein [Muribaculaceae bacterium]